MWWRQNNPDSTYYMFHPNTGCEDKSHTIWAMVNYGYPYPTNKTGLFCCHDGPLQCYCDITQYSFENKGDTLCISADYKDHTLKATKCSDQYDETTWRETYYNDTFIQLENYGNTGGNTYMCLGQESILCDKGTRLKLVPCNEQKNASALFNWM